MSDLFDLDEAFETLTRDVSSRGTGPGATTAIGTSRRRRRTAVGAMVAVAALAIGGVTAAQLGDGDSRSTEVVDDSRRPLPEPAPLSAGLSAATAGWTATWEQVDETGAEADIDAVGCLEQTEHSAALSREPSRSGDATLRTGSGGLAYAAFAEFAAGQSPSEVYDALTRAMTECGAATQGSTTYGDRRRATHLTVATGDRDDDIWVAQVDQGVALLFVSGASRSADEATSLLVGDALVAAMREGSTLRAPAASESGSDSGYASGSEGGDTFEFPTSLGYDQLVSILGPGTSEWRTGGTELFDLPCVAEAVAANSDASTGSTIGSHAVLGYTSYTSFQGLSGMTALETILPMCEDASWTLHPDLVAGDSATWGSSDAGVVFAVQHGPHLGVLQVRDLAAPSDEAAAQVLELLQSSVAAARVVDEPATDG